MTDSAHLRSEGEENAREWWWERRRRLRNQGTIARWSSEPDSLETLLSEVRAFVREYDHPLRDSRKLALDYEAMLRALDPFGGRHV